MLPPPTFQFICKNAKEWPINTFSELFYNIWSDHIISLQKPRNNPAATVAIIVNNHITCSEFQKSQKSNTTASFLCYQQQSERIHKEGYIYAIVQAAASPASNKSFTSLALPLFLFSFLKNMKHNSSTTTSASVPLLLTAFGSKVQGVHKSTDSRLLPKQAQTQTHRIHT